MLLKFGQKFSMIFLRMFRSRNLLLGRGKGNIAGETAMECVILENAAEPDSAAEKQ